MAEPIASTPDVPRWRPLSGFTALTIRQLAGDRSARAVVQACGLAWPETPGGLTGGDPCLAWSGPQERIAIGMRAQPLDALLDALGPGRSETAVAIDLSQAFAVFELSGPHLDRWLRHLVDAAAIPALAGRATRCRFVDVAVTLLRLDAECMWLMADRPRGPYVQDWLGYSLEGEFGSA